MLTAKRVERAKAGRYHDGDGLYLRVKPSGAKSWLLRFEICGRERWMGLGSARAFTLKEARRRAREQRQLLADHIDPIDRRREERAKATAARVKRTTFGECINTFLAFKQPEWTNAKHGKQWAMSLRVYAKPLHALSPADIDLAAVTKTLEPIWHKIPETASRTRSRIEAVLDHWSAKNETHGYSNPAAWARLQHVLASPSKIKDDRHWPALPYARIPEFMRDLRAREGVAARALEFMILTSCRTGDLVGQARDGKPPMRWAHVDPAKHIWTIPNTKTGKQHRVPLADAAMNILDEMRKYGSGDPDDVVFPGARPGQSISSAAMGYVIERMNEGRDGPSRFTDPKEDNHDVVPHGLRSSFRDWSAEETLFPREICEFALGHVVGDKAEAAYWRADVLRKRRQLSEAWSRFCGSPPLTATGATVTPISRAGMRRPCG